MYVAANATLTATAYDKASADRDKLVADAGLGCFGGRALKAREEIRSGEAPCLLFLVPAGLLRRFG